MDFLRFRSKLKKLLLTVEGGRCPVLHSWRHQQLHQTCQCPTIFSFVLATTTGCMPSVWHLHLPRRFCAFTVNKLSHSMAPQKPPDRPTSWSTVAGSIRD